jgi:hypothetical protein
MLQKDGLGRLSALLGKIDPRTDPGDYWIVSDVLADVLHQVESYSEESQVITKLLFANIANQNSPYFQRMQLITGRNLSRSPEPRMVFRADASYDASYLCRRRARCIRCSICR